MVALLNVEEMEAVLNYQLLSLKSGNSLIAQSAAFFVMLPESVIRFVRRIFSFAEQHRDPQKTSNAVIKIFVWTGMPLAGFILRIALPKSRVLEIGQSAADFCEDPLYLPSALRKMQNGIDRLPAKASQYAFDHLWLIRPCRAESRLDRLFDVYPSLGERLSLKLNYLSTDIDGESESR